MKSNNRSFGLTAMAVFLFFEATMETLPGITLLFPGSFLDPMWRFNPEAGEQLRHLGRGIGIAFLGLGAAMIAAVIGWIKRRFWAGLSPFLSSQDRCWVISSTRLEASG